MEEAKIHKIKLSEVDNFAKLCFEHRGEKYYLAYDTNPKKPISLIFKDLTFFRKNFGVNHNENSPITYESLNELRFKEINLYKLAIENIVPLRDLSKFDKNGFLKLNPETNDYYKVDELSKEGQKWYKKFISIGFYILCEIV